MSKKNRKLNYEESRSKAYELQDMGHELTFFTDSHWRIDNYIDVWPARKKFMKQDGKWKSMTYEHLKDIFQ